MIIMVNPINRKIEERGIPVTFNTNLVSYSESKIKNKYINSYNESGNKKYYGSGKKITDSEYSYFVTDKVSASDIYNYDGELDEEFHKSYNCVNTEFRQEASRINKVEITTENIEEFDFDSLMEQEVQNILNDSLYDIAVYDFLDKCVISTSTFQSMNSLLLRMSPDDIVNFTISVSGTYKKYKFINLPEGVGVMINNVLYSDNTEITIIDGDNSISFINQSDNVLNIINPIILLGGE